MGVEGARALVTVLPTLPRLCVQGLSCVRDLTIRTTHGSAAVDGLTLSTNVNGYSTVVSENPILRGSGSVRWTVDVQSTGRDNDCMLLGVLGSHTPSRQDSCYETTCYGWTSHGYVMIKGQGHKQKDGFCGFSRGDRFVLSLECSRQGNTTTTALTAAVSRGGGRVGGGKYVLQLDSTTPTWYLHVVLYYQGSRVVICEPTADDLKMLL